MALFWVKLCCKKIISGDRGATIQTILEVCGHRVGIIRYHVIAVDKVEPGAGLNALPQRVGAGGHDPIPAHVRYLEPLTRGIPMMLAKKGHPPRYGIQAVDTPILFGIGHQRLHANTNCQHWFLVYSERLIEQLITTEIADRSQAVADGPTPGKITRSAARIASWS